MNGFDKQWSLDTLPYHQSFNTTIHHWWFKVYPDYRYNTISHLEWSNSFNEITSYTKFHWNEMIIDSITTLIYDSYEQWSIPYHIIVIPPCSIHRTYCWFNQTIISDGSHHFLYKWMFRSHVHKDNGQNSWNSISIRLSNPATNDSMMMVLSLIIELLQ